MRSVIGVNFFISYLMVFEVLKIDEFKQIFLCATNNHAINAPAFLHTLIFLLCIKIASLAFGVFCLIRSGKFKQYERFNKCAALKENESYAPLFAEIDTCTTIDALDNIYSPAIRKYPSLKNELTAYYSVKKELLTQSPFFQHS